MVDDTVARRRIETDLGASFLVEAAAGTGKTTCLVSRLIAMLAAGTDIGCIVAVTFTDKAAGELRLRLRAGLEVAKAAAEGDARKSLSNALDRLEHARVSTIHRFAGDLLRERPIEAGIDPAFAPCSPAEQRELLGQAFGLWLERVECSPTPALKRYFARPGASASRLRFAAERLIEHRHLAAPWTRRPIELTGEMQSVLDAVRKLAEMAKNPQSRRDKLYQSLSPVLDLAVRLSRHELAAVEAEAALVELSEASFGHSKGWGGYGEGVDRAALFAEVSALKVMLATFVTRASADLAVELQADLLQVGELYRELKARRGALDFDDLLLLARQLLVRDPHLLAQTRMRLRHFFVDEFQDTDSSQAALLLLLASDDPVETAPLAMRPAPGKLFLVGDPKQSIYRFRQADPGTYFLIKEHVIACGGEVLHLNVSFRSLPGIVGFVNAAFSPVMTGDREAEQAEYVPLAARREAGVDPTVFALPIPSPYGKMRMAKSAVRKSHPETVAAFIAWLIEESGHRVRDPRNGELVGVRPEHVAVLFKQFESYGEHRPEVFSRALSRHGVAHIVLGGRALGDRDESHALVTGLSAIEYVDDPLLVYGTLRGPLFGFTDETLFQWQQRYGRLSPLLLPITAWPEPLVAVGHALIELLRLHQARNRRSAAETLADLLAVTRAAVGFALSPAAEQVFLQIGSLEQLAMAHERGGGLSYRSFVDSLGETAGDKGADAEDLDDDAGGVRLSTVYRAKGLEFPVVVLADPFISASRDPEKLVDAKRGLAAISLAGCAPWDLVEGLETERLRAKAEAVRVAYVAATRARDILAIPVVGDAPEFPLDGWLAPLAAKLAPAEPRTPLVKQGDDTVTVRPDDIDRPARSITPGIHAMPWGQVSFVDPSLLARQAGRARSAGALDLITKDADPRMVAEGREALATFLADRAAAILLASVAPYSVQTVTVRSKQEAPGPVALAATSRAPNRPRGKRFGTLVHNMLATAELGASRSRLSSLAISVGRLLGATDEETKAALIAVQAALAHPILERARLAERVGKLHREVPVTFRLGKSEIVEGVIDLSFEEDDAFHVVDYKTDDREAMTPEHLNVYRAQVTLYARAIQEATGMPARATLLFL